MTSLVVVGVIILLGLIVSSLLIVKETLMVALSPLVLILLGVLFIDEKKRGRWVLVSIFIFVGSGMVENMEEYFAILSITYFIFNFAPVINAFRYLWRVNLLFLTYYCGLILMNPSTFQLEAFKFHVIYLFLLHIFISLKFSIEDWVEKIIVGLHYLWVLYAFVEIASNGVGDRVVGPVWSATCFGALLVQSWSLIVARWVVIGWSFKKIVLYSLPGLLAILSTGTRSCLPGVALTYFFVVFYSPERRSFFLHVLKTSVVKGAPIFLLVVIFLLSPWGETFLDRLLFTKTSTGVDMSTFGRFAAWYTAGEIFKISPFFGVGQAQYQEFMISIFPTNIFQEGSVFALKHAHNALLVLVSETGLWGLGHVLILLIMSLKGIFKNSSRISKLSSPLFLSLVITLSLGVLDNIPFYDFSIFFGVILLSLYVYDYDKVLKKEVGTKVLAE